MDRLNDAQLVLIPKNASPSTAGHYRPIAFLNNIFKIVSKVLANRLLSLMISLADESQTGFIARKSITKSIATNVRRQGKMVTSLNLISRRRMI